MPVGNVQPQTDNKPTGGKAKVTRAQLEEAAKLRADGATWNAIRSATGTKLGSSGWFRAWEREGIEHAPAGQKPTPTPIEPASAAAALAESAASTPKPVRATRRRRAAAKGQSAPENKAKATRKPRATSN